MLVESLVAILSKLPERTEVTYKLSDEYTNPESLAESEIDIHIDCHGGFVSAVITLDDI